MMIIVYLKRLEVGITCWEEKSGKRMGGRLMAGWDRWPAC